MTRLYGNQELVSERIPGQLLHARRTLRQRQFENGTNAQAVLVLTLRLGQSSTHARVVPRPAAAATPPTAEQGGPTATQAH